MKRSRGTGGAWLMLLLASGCMDSGTELSPPQAEPVSTALTSSLAPMERLATPGTVTTPEATGWDPTGRMAMDRLLHTATRLQDGRVLVTGGYNRSAEVYNPATGTWSRTQDALTSFRAATATLLTSGQVLVAGSSATLYTPETGTWAATGSLAAPRYYHSATRLPDGRVLVTGGAEGESSGQVLASTELYDPATGTWTATAPLNAARTRHTATLLPSGLVLVTGGQGPGGSPLTAAELYDPASGVWTPVGAMGTARAHHTATLLSDGRVLVAGGAQDGEPSTRAEVYDPATQSWAATAPMKQPRRHHTATLLPSGMVLVTGGYDGYSGIHNATELYDPVHQSWLPMAPMATTRYRHTATLLANGQVLAAGGFSTGDQASAELFSAPYVEVVLDSGTGWRLVNVSGSPTDEEAQPYNTEVYMIDDTSGIDQAPLPDSLREHLSEDLALGETLYILDPAAVEELRRAEQNGLRASAQPSLAACPAPTTHQKSVPFEKPLSYSPPAIDGFTGTVSVNGTVRGTVVGEVRVSSVVVAGLCLGIRVEHLRIHGDATLTLNAALDGTFGTTAPVSWQKEIARPDLFSMDFKVLGIPIHAGFTLPITLGAQFQATTTGPVTYSATQTATLTFDSTCSRQGGCTATADLQPPDLHALLPTSTLSNSGRIRPTLWTQVAIRGSLYDDKKTFAQLGIRPTLHGDLWGSFGTHCGDADGNGAPESLSARTFDLDWDLLLNGQAAFFSSKPKTWDRLWSSPLRHIDFWDLGEPQVFQPLLSGPASVPAYSSAAYAMQMRPCWPYGEPITYELSWGDGTSDIVSGAPQASTSASHTWQAAGLKTLQLATSRDAHGREFRGETSRSVQVEPQLPPDGPSESSRHVTVQGTLKVRDFEFFAPHVEDTFPIHEEFSLNPTSRTATRLLAGFCTGNEVRVEVELHLALQSDDVTVHSRVVGRLYEGEACNTTDLEDTDEVSAFVAKNSAAAQDFQLTNSEPGTDWALFDLTVTNSQQP